jgi:hypothetical protein
LGQEGSRVGAFFDLDGTLVAGYTAAAQTSYRLRRNAVKLNPGTVDIAVLPPVSVQNWTLRNLRERIEQIRTAYLETLSAWPSADSGNPAVGADEEPLG